MRLTSRRVLVLAVLLAVAIGVPVALGSGKRAQVLAAPTGLDTFPLRLGPSQAGEVFWQTPSFKWEAVRGASGYGFELATSPAFRSSELVWSTGTSSTPALTLPLSLPWLAPDGRLYWRVRVTAGNGTSDWSQPAAFGITWDHVPHALANVPGFARWSSVRGATGYEVWLTDKHKIVSTTTTFADFREFYGGKAPQDVHWRVRAIRRLYGAEHHGPLPSVSRGPWSDTYTSKAEIGPSTSLRTLSGNAGLMPGFVFPTKDPTELSHVYVTTDPACADVVFNSAIVHGGAFAPRAIQLNESLQQRFPADAGTVNTSNGRTLAASESVSNPAPGQWAKIDLPDGRYYWTVVAVERRSDGSYRDLQSVRAACNAAKGSFTLTSDAPVLGAKVPFVTGLSPAGHVLSAAATTSFYGQPLVTWKSVPGATRYELQWTHTLKSWDKAGELRTYSTAALLPLRSGTWWYRVRGLDDSSIGSQAKKWSAPAKVRTTAPVYRVTRG